MTAKKPTEILSILTKNGYEAYLVGGCVRDFLLGREIHDWDVTTSATPEEMAACLPRCIPTGAAHGTMTVILGDELAEVTTYRTEQGYEDGRHPDHVTFVRSLPEDLRRRDFTVNAMAMSADGALVDLYGGREDLQNRVLRCVGDPETRFREDSLRILRGLRFSAQLGFTLEPQTRRAMERLGHLCRHLSAERVCEELEKILLSPRPELLAEAGRLELPDGIDLTGAENSAVLAQLPPDRMIRWAGLCRICPRLDLRALRLDRRTIRDAGEVGAMALPESRLGWKRLTAEQGAERARIAAALAGQSALLEEILRSGECLSLRELAVTGRDFPDLHGPEVGTHLYQLLYHVLEHPEDNSREILMNL